MASTESDKPAAEPTADPGADGASPTEGLSGKELAAQQARERLEEKRRAKEERKRERQEARAERKRQGVGRVASMRASAAERRPRLRRKAAAAASSGDGEGNGNGNAKPKLKKLRIAFVFAGLALLAMVSWVFGIMMAVAQDLPDLEARAQYEEAQNSVVLAADGSQLTTLTGNEGRVLVESEEISPLIKQAVVAIEDQRFYEHRGIDFLGIARAIQQDIVAGGAVQGASTITQQFVKNALEAQGSRTVLQKLREAALAYQIERQWSKDKILTNYLNNIYFGNGAYGVEAAARTYFEYAHPGCGDPEERCASLLTVDEAALLAALISSPTAYDPGTNPVDSKAQRNVVLEKMREQGVLEMDDEEFQELLDRPVPAKSQIQPPTVRSKAPYFTDWLRQQIVDKYGAGRAFGGGLTIHSTLDPDMQEAAENAVASRLGGLGPTSAVVVLENGTANVLAMVGGQDFDKAPFNLATNGLRQPGSSFKPFTLVTALKEGHDPGEVYESAPQEIPFEAHIINKKGERVEVTDKFRVSNYDDNYLGSASIATATTYSDNSVYAQLGTDVGINDIVDTAHELGISSKLDDNPAIILGGLKTGVTPLEMAYAYNTLANDGTQVSSELGSRGNGKGPVAIEEVKDIDDKDYVADNSGASGEDEKTTKEVIDPTVATTATDILHTVVTSGTGKNAQVGDDYIWGKTGTTDNNADAWFVGANEDITVAVWVGYPDGSTPMLTEFAGAPVDGGTIPALLWSDIVAAYDNIAATRATEDESDDPSADLSAEPVPVAPTETTVAPEAAAPVEEPAPAPIEEAPAAPATEAPAAPEAPIDSGGTSAGGAVP